MRKMIIRMRKEEEKYDLGEVQEIRRKAVKALVEYLKTFRPKDRSGDSKHALMGPVGKLLTRITNTGEINWDAVKGYILNIHKCQQTHRVSTSPAERLDDAVKHLSELNRLLPPTKWLRTVEDLDDEVFFRVYKEKLVAQRAGMQKQFQEWLEHKFSSVDELNELIGPDYGYSSFEDVEDPWSVPSELENIVKQFWGERKKMKKE
jgi:hypothetical protein